LPGPARRSRDRPSAIEQDALRGAHWALPLRKRRLLGTHGSAVSAKHLQADPDEHVFRSNRRSTNGAGRIAACTLRRHPGPRARDPSRRAPDGS
jgi:hypothetical protein